MGLQAISVDPWIRATGATAQPARLEYIDVARGLCLVWMTWFHALHLMAGSNEAHSFFSGWSTTNFVMLSGFTLGWILESGATQQQSTSRWRRRGWQLLIIAYVSNVFFCLIKESGPSGLTLRRSVEIVLLQTPWSLSSILLPTAALLFSVQPLFRIIKKSRTRRLIGLIVSVCILLSFYSSDSDRFTRDSFYCGLFCFDNSWFGFPLGILYLLGLLAFLFGMFFSRVNSENRVKILSASVVTFVLLMFLVKVPFLYLVRFAATLIISSVIQSQSSLGGISEIFKLLGRSSLLVFLTHRLLLQTAVKFLPGDSAGVEILFLITLLGCSLLCLLKERNLFARGILIKAGF